MPTFVQHFISKATQDCNGRPIVQRFTIYQGEDQKYDYEVYPGQIVEVPVQYCARPGDKTIKTKGKKPKWTTPLVNAPYMYPCTPAGEVIGEGFGLKSVEERAREAQQPKIQVPTQTFQTETQTTSEAKEAPLTGTDLAAMFRAKRQGT